MRSRYIEPQLLLISYTKSGNLSVHTTVKSVRNLINRLAITSRKKIIALKIHLGKKNQKILRRKNLNRKGHRVAKTAKSRYRNMFDPQQKKYSTHSGVKKKILR